MGKTVQRRPVLLSALSSGAVDTYFADDGSVLLKRRKLGNENGTIEPAITKHEKLETWKRLVGPSVCSGHGVCQGDGTCNCDAG